ncbi:MAG: hypothetical protein LUE17_02735 [Planctomycetaceae bacterium]|nr:hypothetical protein [Planctomycetaceae bacterium]
MTDLPLEQIGCVPCCSPAAREPARVLAWSEARVDESGDGVSIALWLPQGVTVAVGLAQVPAVEADVDAMRDDGVGLVRRQSGGGAVLLYPGVLCWEAWADLAEIDRRQEGGSGIRQSYAALSKPVVMGLAAVGITAFHAGICDISVETDNGVRKLAGTAQLRRRERALVHGSLLVTADVTTLSRYLRFPSEQPDYRQGRDHADFCTTVAAMAPDRCGPHFMRYVAGAIVSAALTEGWKAYTPPEALDEAAAAHYRGKYGQQAWNWDKVRPRKGSGNG